MFLTTYKPNNKLSTMDNLNNLFDIFLDKPFDNYQYSNSSNYHIDSDDSGVTLTLNVPGYNKKLIDVSVHNDVLYIEGKTNSGDTNGFSYQFNLSDKLDTSNIDASVVDGILSVNIPYLENVQPKRIEVKVR